MGNRIVRPREAQDRLGIKSSKFWEMVKSGELPPLVRLSPRCVGHLESELTDFVEGLKAKRDRQHGQAA